ncbi:hypothetical protein [Pedobacter miscanthi]|uniref:hypothetical protein n=1 Tax=Pedobacter miscanthi TaxID=2259170 RepID=UPI00292EA207|nr:hypothetical protein [Pedobacter miscanthi]
MKTILLPELSLSELNTEKKRRGALVSFYIATLVVMTVAGMMMTIRKGTTIFTFLPFVFLPIFFSIYKRYHDVKKEIKSRNDA